jgi:hypothetical protein
MDEDADDEPQRGLTPEETYANAFAGLKRLGLSDEQIRAFRRPGPPREEP